MPPPTIFGVPGTQLAECVTQYRVGSGRAVIVDREMYRMAGPRYHGVWQVPGDDGAPKTLCRVEGDSPADVAHSLESWLKVWLAEWCGALGLELRERGHQRPQPSELPPLPTIGS
jgi:hypothetical protein